MSVGAILLIVLISILVGAFPWDANKPLKNKIHGTRMRLRILQEFV
jgi:hypothetical protein